jgi:hypothetical protein
MRKIILLSFILIFLNIQFSLSEENSNFMENTIEQEVSGNEVLGHIEDLENQQINQDEGYGAQDEEYYGSEGNSTQSDEIVNNSI